MTEGMFWERTFPFSLRAMVRKKLTTKNRTKSQRTQSTYCVVSVVCFFFLVSVVVKHITPALQAIPNKSYYITPTCIVVSPIVMMSSGWSMMPRSSTGMELTRTPLVERYQPGTLSLLRHCPSRINQ